MKRIEELGSAVDDRWRRLNYSEDAFSDIAATALATFESSPSFFREVTEWGLGNHCLPFQVDIEGMFGQPPICIYVNPLQTFYIQALVWLDSTTSVHQHGFCGAFKVVEGQSVHTRYAFEATTRVNARMMFGNIDYIDGEVLSLGEVRRIERGDSFIHSVFHLDRPSVTLVVRTFGDTTTGPQFDYLRPWLAVDSFYKSPRLQRNLQIFTAIKEVDRSRYVATLTELIPVTDLFTTYRYVRHFFESTPSDDERSRIDSVVRSAHGELGDKLLESLEHAAQEGFLISKRKQLRDPDHRFFVALLLNVPERDAILRLVESRYPGDPVERVTSWIQELCNDENGMLSPLDESTLYVLKSMVRGSSLDRVVRDLHEEYDAEDVNTQLDDIKELYDRLRTSHFRPVLGA